VVLENNLYRPFCSSASYRREDIASIKSVVIGRGFVLIWPTAENCTSVGLL
jgi:hypothetical protein